MSLESFRCSSSVKQMMPLTLSSLQELGGSAVNEQEYSKNNKITVLLTRPGRIHLNTMCISETEGTTSSEMISSMEKNDR